MSEQKFKPSYFVLAKQIEIFVPKNDSCDDRKVIKWFDNFIQTDRVPLVPATEGSTNSIYGDGAPKYWENIVYGYSIYEASGRFILSTRKEEDIFREDVMIIKLILTNYVTKNMGFPTVVEDYSFPTQGDGWNPPLHVADTLYFLPSMKEDFAKQQGIDIDDYLSEYEMGLDHFNHTLYYIGNTLANEIMTKEEEIWLQSWTTGLQIRFNMTVPSAWRSKVPIVQSKEQKKEIYGEDADDVICVIDYVVGGENRFTLELPTVPIFPPLGMSPVT